MAEIPPSTKPSSNAYIGAVIPAHSFLKMVTMATMKPPMPPMASAGAIACMASSGGALKKRFQVHAAVATQQRSRMPVLLTVPDTVMLSPNVASPVRKASELSAGFEVLINWAMRSLLTSISLPIRRAGRYLDSLERIFALRYWLFALCFWPNTQKESSGETRTAKGEKRAPLEQRLLPSRIRSGPLDAEVFVCQMCCHPAARRPI